MLPLSAGIPLAVELICPNLAPPLKIQAQLVRFGEEQCNLRLAHALADLRPGQQVLIHPQGQETLQIAGTVHHSQGKLLTIDVEHMGPREKRYFPREVARLRVRYRPIPRHQLQSAPKLWLRGLCTIEEEDWQIPEEEMNFSASGLRFVHEDQLELGQLLLLGIQLPDAPQWHRLTAKVVRVESHQGNRSNIALQFEEIEAETVERLADFTLDRQLDALSRSFE